MLMKCNEREYLSLLIDKNIQGRLSKLFTQHDLTFFLRRYYSFMTVIMTFLNSLNNTHGFC